MKLLCLFILLLFLLGVFACDHSQQIEIPIVERVSNVSNIISVRDWIVIAKTHIKNHEPYKSKTYEPYKPSNEVSSTKFNDTIDDEGEYKDGQTTTQSQSIERIDETTELPHFTTPFNDNKNSAGETTQMSIETSTLFPGQIEITASIDTTTPLTYDDVNASVTRENTFDTTTAGDGAFLENKLIEEIETTTNEDLPISTTTILPEILRTTPWLETTTLMAYNGHSIDGTTSISFDSSTEVPSMQQATEFEENESTTVVFDRSAQESQDESEVLEANNLNIESTTWFSTMTTNLPKVLKNTPRVEITTAISVNTESSFTTSYEERKSTTESAMFISTTPDPADLIDNEVPADSNFEGTTSSPIEINSEAIPMEEIYDEYSTEDMNGNIIADEVQPEPKKITYTSDVMPDYVWH